MSKKMNERLADICKGGYAFETALLDHIITLAKSKKQISCADICNLIGNTCPTELLEYGWTKPTLYEYMDEGEKYLYLYHTHEDNYSIWKIEFPPLEKLNNGWRIESKYIGKTVELKIDPKYNVTLAFSDVSFKVQATSIVLGSLVCKIFLNNYNKCIELISDSGIWVYTGTYII